jgi:hypothetical protein
MDVVSAAIYCLSHDARMRFCTKALGGPPTAFHCVILLKIKDSSRVDGKFRIAIASAVTYRERATGYKSWEKNRNRPKSIAINNRRILILSARVRKRRHYERSSELAAVTDGC